jgi:glyoxylase-like metal-dependent hydrolase (beta-lactamase superfamily II)
MSMRSAHHHAADPLPGLQPSPLRPHRRRQGIQGCGRDDHRPPPCPRAPRTLSDPHTPLPDEVFGDEGRTLTLGGTTLELRYLGFNHSDSNIVMLLPREKLAFIVDTIPVGQVPARGMIDFYPAETEEFMRKVMALDWDRFIPGHPGPAIAWARRRTLPTSCNCCRRPRPR